MNIEKNLSDSFTIREITPEYIDERICEVRESFEKKIKIIKDIDDKHFQLLCMLAMLDSLAQEFSNYSKGTQ